jgi:hypothetical protein
VAAGENRHQQFVEDCRLSDDLPGDLRAQARDGAEQLVVCTNRRRGVGR